MPFTAGSWQGSGRVTACEQCGNWMLATCQLSASFCYHAEFQEVFYQKQESGRFVAGSRHGMCESGLNTVGERHGMCESGFNTAGERHGMCESGFNTAGERHGMCESGFNTAGERHGMCESGFN